MTICVTKEAYDNAEVEQQRKREEAWRAKQQEEQDRATYARLKSNYEGKA